MAGTAHPACYSAVRNLVQRIPVVGPSVPGDRDARIQIVLKNVLADSFGTAIAGQTDAISGSLAVGIDMTEEAALDHVFAVGAGNLQQAIVEHQHLNIS